MTTTQLKQIAKELKIKDWWNKKKEVLLKEIAEAKGWSHEPEHIVEYLLNGGEIQVEPTPVFPAPRLTSKEIETMKTERKRPVKKATKPTAKPAPKTNGETITLADICEELGVEGRIARRKLRSSDIKKPGQTWEWAKGDKDINKVKALLE